MKSGLLSFLEQTGTDTLAALAFRPDHDFERLISHAAELIAADIPHRAGR